MKATAGQNLQFVANPDGHFCNQAAVSVAAAKRDLVSDLIDEALGPMSHLGSI